MEINNTNIFSLKPHRFSEMFPTDFTGSGFSELVASVKKLGRLRNPIIIYENQILDGNRRLRACKIAKVQPKWIEFKGTSAEALEVVWDLNYNRRDLTPSLRSVAFAQYCSFLDHGQHPNESGNVTTLDEAAKRAGVSKTTMQHAKAVVQHGTKKDIESIKSGEATVSGVASHLREKPEDGAEDVDASGLPIPKPAQEYWHRRKEAAEVLAELRYAKTKVRALKPEDPMWAEVNLNGVLSDLGNAINRFASAVPAYVCTHCQGQHPKGCTVCKGRGLLSNFMWKSCIPEELKKMRLQQVKSK